MRKLLKQPGFIAVAMAIATLIIGYISNQLPNNNGGLRISVLTHPTNLYSSNPCHNLK